MAPCRYTISPQFFYPGFIRLKGNSGSMREMFLQERECGFAAEREFIVFAGLCFLSFTTPILLPHPQLLTGAVVNSLIVAGALHFGWRKLLPVLVLPSMGAVAAGMLFGPFTIYLLYMAPFIWAGNFILAAAVKYFALAKKSFLSGALLGAGAKAAFLFCSAYALFSFGLVPAAFLAAMGMTQLFTALAGGALGKGLSHILVSWK